MSHNQNFNGIHGVRPQKTRRILRAEETHANFMCVEKRKSEKEISKKQPVRELNI
jgi:hypothetical protein